MSCLVLLTTTSFAEEILDENVDSLASESETGLNLRSIKLAKKENAKAAKPAPKAKEAKDPKESTGAKGVKGLIKNAKKAVKNGPQKNKKTPSSGTTTSSFVGSAVSNHEM